MTTGKALNGKPYAGNPHVRFDEGEVASAAMPRRGSLLYTGKTKEVLLIAFVAVTSFMAPAETWPDGSVMDSWFADRSPVEESRLGRLRRAEEFGARPDNGEMQTEKLQRAIDAIAADGGGVLVLGPGVWNSSAIFFKPCVHLKLEKGAVLRGPEDGSAVPSGMTHMIGHSFVYTLALINADACNGFTIYGEGTIDGNGKKSWADFWKKRKTVKGFKDWDIPRPRNVYVSRSRDVRISGVNIKDSHFWTVQFYKCERVKVDHVRITAPGFKNPPAAPSSDAIDLDAVKDAHVWSSYMDVNDDAVVVKGGWGYKCETLPDNGANFNVLVEDCVFGPVCHHAFTCGSDAFHCRNLVLRNSEVRGCRALLNLKSRPDTKQLYEHILVENVSGWCRDTMLMRPWTQWYNLPKGVDKQETRAVNVVFRNCNVKGKENVKLDPSFMKLDGYVPPSTVAYAPPSVVFDTPAKDEKGIMVLGNGEVGATAWLDAAGVLHTVLQNSDSWNEGGRHVKTGAIDYETKAPVDAGTYRQELSMARGEFEASWKSGGKPVSVRYRVQHGTDSIAVCDVKGAPDAEAKVVNWRLYPGGAKEFGVGEYELGNRFCEGGPYGKVLWNKKFTISADRLVSGGWCHVNRNETVKELMKVYDYYQATGDLGKPDLLSDRVFGGVTRRLGGPRFVAAEDGTKPVPPRILFLTAVTCLHPCKDDAEWLRRTNEMLDRDGWTIDQEKAKRAAHIAWWRAFWDRSHITVTPAVGADKKPRREFKFPKNEKLPVRFGLDSKGGNKFLGKFSFAEIEFGGKKVYAGVPKAGDAVAKTAIGSHAKSAKSAKDPEGGKLRGLGELCVFRFACRITTDHLEKPQRLLDNMTPGGTDGFLVDIYKGRVRGIFGKIQMHHSKKVVAGRETAVEVRVSRDGEAEIVVDGKTERRHLGRPSIPLADECAAITTAYAAQRYLTACAGRGRLPVRFNGSLFTISHRGDPDYRRWGNGYWWQNTRLPYYPMFAAGDIDGTDALFGMYLGKLEFLKKRTKKYFEHDGAYFPECMQPWGDHFMGCYGPECEWKLRKDKHQYHPCHKYAWVGQMELSLMAIMRWQYTRDDAWFKKTALPAIREFVRYFDEHYKLDAKGRYHMYPAQAVETWQDCTNPMTEISGLMRVTDLMLAMPDSVLAPIDREFFAKVRARVPDLPTRTLKDGSVVFAPAEIFKRHGNVETPELYCVFPFRLSSFEKPNAEIGRRTYTDGRFHKLYFGWAQDELNAAYLGLAEEARVHIVDRVFKNTPSLNRTIGCSEENIAERTYRPSEYRWPAYWGPNYNWRPDQDEGGVYQNTIQSMLMQYEGDKIFLLPAWPKEWNCDFKLHAPRNTTVEGRVENGELKDLVVTPASRRKDVTVVTAAEGSGRRYAPIPGGYAKRNGEAEFNRPLYGWHGDDRELNPRKSLPWTGDRPKVALKVFSGYRIDNRVRGVLQFGDGTEDVTYRYVWGRAEYDLKGKGTVKMVRSAASDGLLVETTGDLPPKFDGEWTLAAKGARDGRTYYDFERKGFSRVEHVERVESEKNVAAMFDAATNHFERIARTIEIKTPDSLLDSLLPCQLLVADAMFEGRHITHGATNWKQAYAGWRIGYICYATGWEERFKENAREHFRSQKADGRIPNEPKRDSFYNMCEEFVVSVMRYWKWTHDDDFMREIAYGGVKRHLEWMDRNMKVPGAELYENWLNTWNTDDKWTNGGAGTISSAYYAFDCRVMSEVAQRLGKAEDAAYFAARSKAVEDAIAKRLWHEGDGVWGEYRERFGLKRLMRAPDLSTVYIAIDNLVPDLARNRRAVFWVEDNVPTFFAKDGASLLYSSNRLPLFWTSCGRYPNEMIFWALACYQAGEPELGWRNLHDAAAVSARGAGCGPGVGTCDLNFDFACYGNIDFADNTAGYLRAVTEGVFGIVEGREIRPSFPASWNEAEIKSPYISYRWTRTGGVEVTGGSRAATVKVVPAPKPQFAGAAIPPRHTRWGHPKGEGSDLTVPQGAKAEFVDLSKSFNQNLRLLHAGKYSPRIDNKPWSGLPRTIMANGRTWWEHHETVGNRHWPKDYAVPKTLERWPEDGALATKYGPAFHLGPKEGKNAAFTSFYEQFPDAVEIPLSGKARKLALLSAVVTNPNVAWMEAACVKVQYADGTEEELSLVPPDNCDDWLNYSQGQWSYYDAKRDNKPYAVKGRPVMLNDRSHANAHAIALDPAKELKSLRIECRGTETFAGILGATLYR